MPGYGIRQVESKVLKHSAWQMANSHYTFQTIPMMMMTGYVSLRSGAQAVGSDDLVLNPSSAICQLCDFRQVCYIFCRSILLFVNGSNTNAYIIGLWGALN